MSSWRCFHCDEFFTDREAAALHFGDHLQGDPACKLNAMEGGLLALVRAQEQELQAFRTEETASYREFFALGAQHTQAIHRAEELGYARGLADARHARLLDLAGEDRRVSLPYIYRWDRQGRKGQPCRVLVRGSMNSCLVEFADGYRMVTSRNALRKAQPNQAPETIR